MVEILWRPRRILEVKPNKRDGLVKNDRLETKCVPASGEPRVARRTRGFAHHARSLILLYSLCSSPRIFIILAEYHVNFAYTLLLAAVLTIDANFGHEDYKNTVDSEHSRGLIFR